MSKKRATPTVAEESGAQSAERHHQDSRKPHIMSDRVWLVLARRAYDEPLRQVGTVEADDIELAGVYARSIYDEFAWVEMAIVPRDALVSVIAS